MFWFYHVFFFFSILFFLVVIMSLFFFLCSLFSHCCPLAHTSIPLRTPVLSLFYPALYVFGFLLILLAGCCRFSGSQQGLVARCSLYSRHLDSKAVDLLDTRLPGKLRLAVFSDEMLTH